MFEPAARAFDSGRRQRRKQEFARKARTIAGTFQLFSRERWLFDPRRNRLWFATMSHKGLRLLLPVLHAGALAANIAAAGVWPYQWLLVAQAVFYAAAIAGGDSAPRPSSHQALHRALHAVPAVLGGCRRVLSLCHEPSASHLGAPAASPVPPRLRERAVSQARRCAHKGAESMGKKLDCRRRRGHARAGGRRSCRIAGRATLKARLARAPRRSMRSIPICGNRSAATTRTTLGVSAEQCARRAIPGGATGFIATRATTRHESIAEPARPGDSRADGARHSSDQTPGGAPSRHREPRRPSRLSS